MWVGRFTNIHKQSLNKKQLCFPWTTIQWSFPTQWLKPEPFRIRGHCSTTRPKLSLSWCFQSEFLLQIHVLQSLIILIKKQTSHQLHNTRLEPEPFRIRGHCSTTRPKVSSGWCFQSEFLLQIHVLQSLFVYIKKQIFTSTAQHKTRTRTLSDKRPTLYHSIYADIDLFIIF